MKTWKLPDDARKSGLKFPNYDIRTTPSGHSLVFDDSVGAESITLEHRSGSLIQIQASGDIVFISKAGAYTAVFGDHNILVTGAQNITVNGGASIKVEGDYDMTVAGTVRHSIAGNLETTVAGDHTMAVAGKFETVVGGDSSLKVAGGSETLASRLLMASEGDIRMTGGEVSLVSDGNVDLAGDGVQVASSTLTHNGVNVGDDHTHLGVMAGSDETDIPT